MTYEDVITALADPTRRAILEALRHGPRSVTEIADEMPVSRPAVSQHLAVLRNANLVTEERDGTRRLYAFALFTERMGTWWPIATHSLGESRTVSCGIDPRIGGQVFELLDDGTRHQWGRVIAWEPPARVAFSWHPGHDESEAQQVELTFAAEGDATRVVLRHYGWEALGDKAAAVREGYANGWQSVFGELYAGAASRLSVAEARA